MTTFFALQFFAFLGLVGHWYKRYRRNQTDNSFIDYMLSHTGYTSMSIITQIAGVFLMLATGVEEITMQTVGAAFMVGYMCDSAINKDHYSKVK